MGRHHHDTRRKQQMQVWGVIACLLVALRLPNVVDGVRRFPGTMWDNNHQHQQRNAVIKNVMKQRRLQAQQQQQQQQQHEENSSRRTRRSLREDTQERRRRWLERVYYNKQQKPQQQQEGEEGQSERRRMQEGESGGLPSSPIDHLVTDLPLLKKDAFKTKHFAGHLPASPDDDKKFFYWLFEPDLTQTTSPSDSDNTSSSSNTADPDNDPTIPLIIWLNGGPGCSSMDGLFIEHGPFRLVPPTNRATTENMEWQIQVDPHSWHFAPAYTLYLDQPVGTGLSFTKRGNYCKNDLQVNEDFYFFLMEFLIFHGEAFIEPVDDDNNNDNNSDGGETSNQEDPASTTTTGGGTPLPRRWRLKRPLYFSGESHAGHYIPSMMDFILQKNDEIVKLVHRQTNNNANNPLPEEGLRGGGGGSSTDDHDDEPGFHDSEDDQDARSNYLLEIPVAGAAIGNGWTDPYYQYAAADAAYGMGLIGLAQRNSFAHAEEECQTALEAKKYTSSKCFNLLDDIIKETDPEGKYKVSQYDTRHWELAHAARSFPPGHKVVEAYLGNVNGNKHARNVHPPWSVQSSEVIKSLHASEATEVGQYYQECTDPPYVALSHQDGLGVVEELVRVLQYPNENASAASDKKVRVLFFNGVTDLICNHVGNEKFLAHLPWEHATEWNLAERYVWRANGVVGEEEGGAGGYPAGYMKEFENLYFLKVLNSGHMVPLDQPRVAFEMIRAFIQGESFRDNAQSLARAIASPAPDNDASSSSPIGNNGGGGGGGGEESCEPCPTLDCTAEIAAATAAAASQSNNENVDTGGGTTSTMGQDDSMSQEGGGDENEKVDSTYLEKKQFSSGETSYNEAAVNHSIIALGWIGALLGCFALAVYVMFYHQPAVGADGGGARRMMTVVANDSDEEYMADQEEMGGGVGGTTKVASFHHPYRSSGRRPMGIHT